MNKPRIAALPNFTADGVLPAGDYGLTLDELRNSMLVYGPVDRGESWDSAWRTSLVDNAATLVRQLWLVGIESVFLDGSFVENKDHPGDIDGYFECDEREFVTGQLAARLNQISPEPYWTWYRERGADGKMRLPTWNRFRVELYPEFGALSGILDEHGNNQQFPAAFRKRRTTFIPKGIVRVVRRSETRDT